MTDTQAITVRLPRELYEWLRRRAFDTHASQASIVLDALYSLRDFTQAGPRQNMKPPLNETERRVWNAWGTLPDGHPSPVKQIAHDLGMSNADVSFIVYPAEKFGRWEDDQEPDLP